MRLYGFNVTKGELRRYKDDLGFDEPKANKAVLRMRIYDFNVTNSELSRYKNDLGFDEPKAN